MTCENKMVDIPEDDHRTQAKMAKYSVARRYSMNSQLCIEGLGSTAAVLRLDRRPQGASAYGISDIRKINK